MSQVNRQTEISGGFTLIELLVVVFLIGLISGFAVLSVSSKGDDRDIEEQMRLLRYQLMMAGEESVVQGLPVGVWFEQGKYSFLIAGKSKWLELDDGRVFQSKSLLRDWKFELQSGSEKVQLVKPDEDNEENELIPQIIFYSNGEIDPFELMIVDENNAPRYRIWYGDNGEIALDTINDI